MTLQLQEPYAARPIRFLELWTHGGWRLKLYSIAYGRQVARPELVSAAKRLVAERLPLDLQRAAAYGVGYAGVHDGRGANFVFTGWWANENELHYHVWTGPSDDLAKLRPAESSDAIACVWDARVIAFERQAWLDTVLRNPQGASLQAYLDCRLNEIA